MTQSMHDYSFELQDCNQVVRNIARVLQLCGANVPFYVGCDRPMLGQSLPATHCEPFSKCHFKLATLTVPSSNSQERRREPSKKSSFQDETQIRQRSIQTSI